MRNVKPLHPRHREQAGAACCQHRHRPVLLAAQQHSNLHLAFHDPAALLRLLPADVRRLIAGAISGAAPGLLSGPAEICVG